MIHPPKDYYVLKTESNYDRMKHRNKRIKLILNTILWITIIGFIAGNIIIIATS